MMRDGITNRIAHAREGCAVTAVVGALVLVAMLPSSLAAQVCQTPLFIQEAAVEANVMILLDNSGSMNEAIFHPNYDPNTEYVGDYNRESMYYVGTSGWYTVNGRTAYLVRSYEQSGRYIGNYLNWIFWVANDEELATLPVVTRIQVAQVVVSEIIDRSQGLRWGMARFNNADGGEVISPCGTPKAEVIDDVQHTQGVAWTPLGETLEDILSYFKTTGEDAPIQASCQKNFLIVMTDGYPTMDRDVSAYLHDADGDGNDPGDCESMGAPYPNSNDCSDHMDDVAYWMRHNDLRADLPGSEGDEAQTVVTYTIGFGIDAGILWDTAWNGDGLYLLADDAAELWVSLELVILDIISRISTGAAVAVVSTERGTDDRLFRGKFMPNSWAGFLEAFYLPYENGDPPVWEAGYGLAYRSSGSRDIFTALGTTVYELTEGQGNNLYTAMGVASPEKAAEVIAWTRGEDLPNYRDREGWKLGDIIHSTPVVVGPPSSFTDDPDYQAFMAAQASRPRMVYVGANDGMLHSFYASSGWEAWSFVPEFALPMLADIADTNYCHLYSVDQTPSVSDMKVDGIWRTMLVCGGRQGGASFFCIDVTTPLSPEIEWQVTLPDGHAFASEATLTNIANTPVALIGSGLNTADGRGYIYAYDVTDGDLIGSILLSTAAGGRNKVATPEVIDLDLDENADVCYVSDLTGTVWRIEFGEHLNPNTWDVTALYSGGQPITAPPTAAFGESNAVYVYFGTGAYLEVSDISAARPNSFFCVIDRHDGNESPDLVDVTDGGADIGGHDGWFYNLHQDDRERITEPAAVVAGAVFFTSFAPSSDPCTAGGYSWLYRMDYENGGVPDDGEEDTFGGSRVVGLDEGVASRAVVDIVNETVIVQSSDATITIEEIGQTFFHLNVRSWQEDFDQVEEVNEPETPPGD